MSREITSQAFLLEANSELFDWMNCIPESV